jgi:hypothetical protein
MNQHNRRKRSVFSQRRDVSDADADANANGQRGMTSILVTRLVSTPDTVQEITRKTAFQVCSRWIDAVR